MTEPTIADLVPFLTERGQVELELALARWQNTQLIAQVAELEDAQREHPHN